MSYDYVVNTGLLLADTSDILSVVQDEYKDVLGKDLVVTSDTPQGVIIVTETEARSSHITGNAQVANQINPNFAGDVIESITISEK